MKNLMLIPLLFFVIHCGNDKKALNPNEVTDSYNRYMQFKGSSPAVPNSVFDPVGDGPNPLAPKVSSILNSPVLDRMTLTRGQYNVLYYSCFQFLQAKDCLLNTTNMLTAGRCYFKWVDEMKLEKRKLIAAGIITEAEEKEVDRDYDRNSDICEEKAKREHPRDYLDAIGREIANYRCLRPHVEKRLQDLTVFFSCDKIFQ